MHEGMKVPKKKIDEKKEDVLVETTVVEPETITVKVIVAHAGPHGSFVAGNIASIEAAIAKSLVKCGYAELIEKAVDPKEVEVR